MLKTKDRKFSSVPENELAVRIDQLQEQGLIYRQVAQWPLVYVFGDFHIQKALCSRLAHKKVRINTYRTGRIFTFTTTYPREEIKALMKACGIRYPSKQYRQLSRRECGA